MRLRAFLFPIGLIFVTALTALGQPVSGGCFPSDFEFQELRIASSEATIQDAARLAKIDGGHLFLDVGFDNYVRRDYRVGDSNLSIEVITLRDNRAAYSLLTLLRDSAIQKGPPGDAFAADAKSIRFAQARVWVRIQSGRTHEDLLERIANSVSRCLGAVRQAAPSLVAHLPKLGYDASTLRYYPGTKSYQSYTGSSAPRYFKTNWDMEIAQARYSLENYSGVLLLLSFPTSQVAEEYFAELATPEERARTGENRIYAKRAGPLVALLDGTYDPGSADRILSTLSFSYSIRWIYEKPVKPATIWGLPVGILGTVVKSFFFVVLLCVISIVAGAGFAIFRVVLRRYAPHNTLDNPERTEITRLRLR